MPTVCLLGKMLAKQKSRDKGQGTIGNHSCSWLVVQCPLKNEKKKQ